MQKDPLVKEALGEHIFNRFIEGKQEEWKQYAEQVHDWEIKSYLGKY